MALNGLIHEYGWLGLFLPAAGLLAVGLCFLALQWGARRVVMQRARPGSALDRWGSLLEEGGEVVALLTLFSLAGGLFGSWRWGLLSGCGFVLMLVLLALIGELLLSLARGAVRLLKLVPPLEAEVLRLAVAGSEASARQGHADVGVDRLRAGLQRAEAAREREEPWADELTRRYREAIDAYARRFGTTSPVGHPTPVTRRPVPPRERLAAFR
jgi:hypothetical protein